MRFSPYYKCFCLSSSLHSFVEVCTSGVTIVDHPWGQLIITLLSWWKIPFYAALLDKVQIGSVTPICPIPGELFQISVLCQIRQGPFNRGAWQIQIWSDPLNSRPAFSLSICTVMQIHIDYLRSGRQSIISIYGSKVTHSSSSLCVFMRFPRFLFLSCAVPLCPGME